MLEASQASSQANIPFILAPSRPSIDAVVQQAILLVEQVKNALIELQCIAPDLLPVNPTDEELLQFPVESLRLDDNLLTLPKRDSSNHELAVLLASLLYPIHTDSLASIIRYEHDRVRICRYIRLQRRYDVIYRTRDNDVYNSRLHIRQQGPWEPQKYPVSLQGPPSLPMPVEIASAASLEPFFTHLRRDGTHDAATLDASSSAQGVAEPFYGVPALEFPRGVMYQDGRLDLCKMVVGPAHIGALMESLRSNTFIRHFLLGNNIIGPKGAREIATFLKDYPGRIDTWYLAGNAIYGPAFSALVNAMIKSLAITNIWLKRNPLGALPNDPVDDLFRLITETPNLRTLDLDQTELGDAHAFELFERLVAHGETIKLRNLYLNGNGIHVKAAGAIGRFLASPHCNITSLYMSNNPIGDEGVKALSTCLSKNRSIMRLSLQSVGLSDTGVEALVNALQGQQTLRALDIGTSYSTKDLGQVYNVLTNATVPHIIRLLATSAELEYLNLGIVLMATDALNIMLGAASQSSSLLYYFASPAETRNRWATELVEHDRLARLLKAQLTANVKAKYGPDMSYDEWHAGEKRWCMSDKTDVRKIDSVYRNRDMGLARRGLKKLDKWWREENERILQDAMDDGKTKAVGPFCSRKRGIMGGGHDQTI